MKSTRPSTAFLKTYLAALAVMLLALATFNGFMDVYGIFNLVRVDGLNRKLNLAAHVGKPYEIAGVKPDVVVFGSSRVKSFKCEDVMRWDEGGGVCYNAYADHAGMRFISRFMQHAMFLHRPRRVYLGVDFFGFNSQVDPFGSTTEDRFLVSEDGRPSLWIVNDLLRLLLSEQVFRRNCASLAANMAGDGVKAAAAPGAAPPKARKPYLDGISRVLIFYKNYAYAGSGGGRSSLEDFRHAVRLCLENGVVLDAFINPFHASLLELFARNGLLEGFLDWKEDLVRIVDEEARRIGDPEKARLVHLWDFSGYNPVTTEPLPPDDEPSRMRYWENAFHYTPEVARFMLARLHGDEARAMPGFGRLLDSKSLPQSRREIVDGLDPYYRANKAVLDESMEPKRRVERGGLDE